MSNEIGLKTADAKPSSLRELTPAEWELVAGGYWTDGFGNPEINVEGKTPSDPNPWGTWPYYPDYDDNGDYDYGGGGGGGGEPMPTDADSHDVTLGNIDRPLKPEEQAAVDALKAFITKVTPAINAIPDNAVLKLKEGGTITGAEVKKIWANTDYVINEKDTKYRNETTRGEANLNGGNPVISFNIDLLVNKAENTGYALSPGGIEFVALHDFAHLLGAAQAYDIVVTAGGLTAAEAASREQMANTIAWAIGQATHETLLTNPEHGYDPAAPTFEISTPAPSPTTSPTKPGDRDWRGSRR